MAQFKLSSAQVPEDLYWLYELVGLERFLKIIDTAGGEFLYFPKRSTLAGSAPRGHPAGI